MNYQDVNLNELSRKILAVENVSDGKEKMSIDDVIKNFPKGISIIGVDKFTSPEDEEYYAFVFEEAPDRFFYGGSMLKRLAENWFACIPSANALNKKLEEEPIRVKLEKVRTKKGGFFTKVILLGNENFKKKNDFELLVASD